MSCKDLTSLPSQSATELGADLPPPPRPSLPWEKDPRKILDYLPEQYIAICIAENGVPDSNNPLEDLRAEYLQKAHEQLNRRTNILDFDWLSQRIGEKDAAKYILGNALPELHTLSLAKCLAPLTRAYQVAYPDQPSKETALARHREAVEETLAGPYWAYVPKEVLADYPDLAQKYDILLEPPAPPFPENCPNLNAAFTRSAARRMERYSRDKGAEIREWAEFCTLNEAVYLPFGSVEAAEKRLSEAVSDTEILLTSNRGTPISAGELHAAIDRAKQWEAALTARSAIQRDFKSSADVRQACETLGGDQFIIRFKQPSTVAVSSRKSVVVKEIQVQTFISTRGNFCYQPRNLKRTGFLFSSMPIAQIASIEKVDPQRSQYAVWLEDTQKLYRLAQAIPSGVWTDLKKEISEQPEEYAYSRGVKTVNMSATFGRETAENIRNAFALRQDYSFEKRGEKRDRSVKIKVQPDGSLKAWYSSEYAGTGNGSYYLLINPTTALFYEDD